MSNTGSTVFVIDDDPSVRRATERLLKSAGLRGTTFASASEFLKSSRPDCPACLVLDVRLPGLSGLDLQRDLAECHVHIPIIFVTGHGDIPMSVQAMKSGAVEFLTKPFRDQALLDAVVEAIERDRITRRKEAEIAQLRGRLAELTAREKEVMSLVVRGLLNKQIAAQLGITEKTIKVHRARVMMKMNAGSLADLVRMAEKLRELEAAHWTKVQYHFFCGGFIVPIGKILMANAAQKSEHPLIGVVDDDKSVRESIRRLLTTAGFKATAFASAEDLLASSDLDQVGCLILDVRMPGMGGVALQQKLARTHWRIPVIFITAHADEQARFITMQAGAVDFLYKPFSEELLLRAIDAALANRQSQ
jgi:FixJ family two-component response regulator